MTYDAYSHPYQWHFPRNVHTVSILSYFIVVRLRLIYAYILQHSTSETLGESWRRRYHSGWTPFYFMYDPKCSTTFPWCTINAPAAFAWCTINVPAAFARCTNRFVHKVEFSYIGWNGVHPLWLHGNLSPLHTVYHRWLGDSPHKGLVIWSYGVFFVATVAGDLRCSGAQVTSL